MKQSKEIDNDNKNKPNSITRSEEVNDIHVEVKHEKGHMDSVEVGKVQ